MFCGVDVGSRSIEVVLFDGAQIVETGVADTGHKPTVNAEKLLHRVLESADVSKSEIKRTVATGYGRNYFTGADRTMSEILCHAGGVSYLFPDARTVIDIGGQDSKLIELDHSGKPVDFSMNDRCAAGTGKFIEMIGSSLAVEIDNMYSLVAGHTDSVEISTMCAVFAESEIIGLLQSGTPVPTILKGVFRSVAKRTLGMAGGNGIIPKLVFTGGVALNKGVVAAIREETGLDVSVPEDPRITGALGAAIVASK